MAAAHSLTDDIPGHDRRGTILEGDALGPVLMQSVRCDHGLGPGAMDNDAAPRVAPDLVFLDPWRGTLGDQDAAAFTIVDAVGADESVRPDIGDRDASVAPSWARMPL